MDDIRKFKVGDEVEVSIGNRTRDGVVVDVAPATCILGLDISSYTVKLDSGKRAVVKWHSIWLR